MSLLSKDEDREWEEEASQVLAPPLDLDQQWVRLSPEPWMPVLSLFCFPV